jgi:uridine kinase
LLGLTQQYGKSPAVFLGRGLDFEPSLGRLSDAGYAIAATEIDHSQAAAKDRVAEIIAICKARDIDVRSSWSVGTDPRQVEAAHLAGMRTVLLRSKEQAALSQRPDFECLDGTEAVGLILDLWPAVEARARRIAPRVNAGETVAIGGPARTGKSTWASALAISLRARGIPTVVIGLDGWLRDVSLRPAKSSVLERYDMEAIERFLETMRPDSVVTIPFYDRLTRSCRGSCQTAISAGCVVIFEGVVALIVPKIKKIAAHRIYIERAEAARYSALLADYMARGYELPAFQHLYSERLSDEMPIVLASRESATLCLGAIESS